MDPVLNPFLPGPGIRPTVLAGREVELDKFRILFARLKRGNPATPAFMYGLRGVGKTVLLLEIDELAKKAGFIVERMEVDEDSVYNFQSIVFNRLKSILLKLDTLENLKSTFRRALSIMKSISLNYQGVELSLDVEPALGEADSKNFQDDLTILMTQVGEIAKTKGKAVCLLIDELQNLSELEMAGLLGALHRCIQENLPITVVGAGLPSLLAVATAAKSYSERLAFIEIGPLNEEQASIALANPIEKEHARISADAVKEVVQITKGYPYFIQQFGETIWNEAKDENITLEEVQKAIPIAISQLDNSFFRARYERSTDEERRFMLCMADLGRGPYETGSIGKCLERSPQHVAQYRNRLMEKGFIYSTSHGRVDFTVPLFDQFLLRQNR